MVTQGAASQWLQRRTRKYRRWFGNGPRSMYFTQVRNAPSGTRFSSLHATVHAWQPMHLRWSITKPYLILMGAPIWPPNPPTFGPPRETRGGPLSWFHPGGPDMAPNPPTARSAPGNPWRPSVLVP